MEQGMDPQVKKYFRKIMNSFALGLLWMLASVLGGLYFGLAIFTGSVHWYNYLFYALFLVSFAALIRYYYKVWKE